MTWKFDAILLVDFPLQRGHAQRLCYRAFSIVLIIMLVRGIFGVLCIPNLHHYLPRTKGSCFLFFLFLINPADPIGAYYTV